MSVERTMMACGLAAAALAGWGCAGPAKTAGAASPAVVSKASDAEAAELLGRVKTLDGEWEMTGPDGEKGYAVFKTMAAGSAVREIMFPGTAHEMTNVYHMDGPSLIVTHYCAAGNQPRMRATRASTTWAAADRGRSPRASAGAP